MSFDASISISMLPPAWGWDTGAAGVGSSRRSNHQPQSPPSHLSRRRPPLQPVLQARKPEFCAELLYREMTLILALPLILVAPACWPSCSILCSACEYLLHSLHSLSFSPIAFFYRDESRGFLFASRFCYPFLRRYP